MNIYVGNFSYDITGEELREIFAGFGHVESVKIIRDKFTGESRGFAFVEMPGKSEAEAAMNGITEIKGRQITINEAKPQVRRNSVGPRRDGARGKSFNKRERRY